MGHDVFISYSSKDKTIADAVTANLESQKLRCWIAPRDIRPGENYGGSIVTAVENSKVMIIIFSNNSNNSQHVLREIERAVNHNIAIIPFRIENVKMSKPMEYFLSTPHWLDAYDTEQNSAIDKLVASTYAIIHPSSVHMDEPVFKKPETRSLQKNHNKRNMIIMAGIVGLLVVALFWSLSTSRSSNDRDELNSSKPQLATEDHSNIYNHDQTFLDNLEKITNKGLNLTSYYFERHNASDIGHVTKYWVQGDKVRIEFYSPDNPTSIVLSDASTLVSYNYVADFETASKSTSASTTEPKYHSLMHMYDNIYANTISKIDVISINSKRNYVLYLGDAEIDNHMKIYMNLDGFIYKAETVNRRNTSVQELSNYKAGPFEASLFEVPDDVVITE